VLEKLGARSEYGGTTLEAFAVCSYRWFVDKELRPQSLGPMPEGIEQGNLMHGVLERLYSERPAGDPVPRPGSLALWLERGRELVTEQAVVEGLSGGGSGERAVRRRVERLLEAFLQRESALEEPLLEPRLLEATFGDDADSEKPGLKLDGWSLHGRIDRVDITASGSGLVQDYKVAREGTPAAKFAEKGKLQLPLYLIALRDLWGIEPVGGLYQPLKATDSPRPRGLVLQDAASDLAGLELVGPDRVTEEAFEAHLAKASTTAADAVRRMRAGEIKRDPIDGKCPRYCDFAPICRREREAVQEKIEDEEASEVPV
jgi:RecB family exonuclease